MESPLVTQLMAELRKADDFGRMCQNLQITAQRYKISYAGDYVDLATTTALEKAIQALIKIKNYNPSIIAKKEDAPTNVDEIDLTANNIAFYALCDICKVATKDDIGKW